MMRFIRLFFLLCGTLLADALFAAGTATVMTSGSVSFTKEKFNEVIANLRVSEI